MKLYYNALDANVYFDNLYPADVVNNFGDTIFRSTPGAIGTQATIMTLKGTGNVGIGTTSPSEKLEVSGTVKATGYKSSDGSAGVSGSFTTTDGKTITIKDGLVTSIV